MRGWTITSVFMVGLAVAAALVTTSPLAATKQIEFRDRSDEGQYFIAFVGSRLGKVGYAYVVWGREDANLLMSTHALAGFYTLSEKKSRKEAALTREVPGELRDECRLGFPALKSLVRTNPH